MKNSINFLKRFLEPILLDKKEALGATLISVLTQTWLVVMPFIFIPMLISSLQMQNIRNLVYIAIVIPATTFTLFFIRYFIRGFFWYSPRKYMSKLELKYRPIILKKESVFYETNGTGKIQSIVEHGLDTWSKTVNETIWYITEIFIILTISIFIISKMGLLYLLFFFIYIIMACLCYVYFRYKKYELDVHNNEIRNLYNHSSVRSIMSRTEILYSLQIDKEVQNLSNLKLKQYEIGKKADVYGFWSFAPGEYISLILPYLGTIIYLYQNNFKLENSQIFLVLGFIYFTSRLSHMIWSFYKFIGEVADALPDIQKLWDFIYNVPDMKGYDTGVEFLHRGGEIELRGVNFSYEQSGENKV